MEVNEVAVLLTCHGVNHEAHLVLVIGGLLLATFLAAALLTTFTTTMSAQSGGGTIEGQVKLAGTPPRNAPIQMGADPNCLKINAGKRVVQETVLLAADGGLGNVFVHVQGTFPQSSAPSTSVVIDQQGCVYHPRIQGARVGQTLEVKNSDQTLHNVHSLTTKSNAFNSGQPQAGMVSKFPLKAEEVMLHIKCDVHPWMVGYVGVVSHPYFAVTDATGTFTIANVPGGKAHRSGVARAVRPADPDARRQSRRNHDCRFQLHGHREALDTRRLRRAGTDDPERRDGDSARCCIFDGEVSRHRCRFESLSGRDVLARAVFNAAAHHNKSSISASAATATSASPACTSPPWY